LDAEDAFFAAGVAASRRNYRAAKVWPKNELSPLNDDPLFGQKYRAASGRSKVWLRSEKSGSAFQSSL
jgi:hypothetical protein